MTVVQIEALRLMIQKETLAAVLEGELLFAAGDRHRLSRRELESRMQQLREEAKRHAYEAVK